MHTICFFVFTLDVYHESLIGNVLFVLEVKGLVLAMYLGNHEKGFVLQNKMDDYDTLDGIEYESVSIQASSGLFGYGEIQVVMKQEIEFYCLETKASKLVLRSPGWRIFAENDQGKIDRKNTCKMFEMYLC